MNSYILGLMATDGSMSLFKGYYREVIELSDEQLVRDVANYFGVNCRHRSRVIKDKERNFYSVTIPKHVYLGNEECFRGNRDGLFEIYQKSNKAEFMRGIFDGDGTVCEMSNSKTLLRVGFSINSKHEDIHKIILDFMNEHSIKVSSYLDKRGGKSYFISINKKADIDKFFNLIYPNAKIYLKRKYNVFISHGFPDLVMSQ